MNLADRFGSLRVLIEDLTLLKSHVDAGMTITQAMSAIHKVGLSAERYDSLSQAVTNGMPREVTRNRDWKLYDGLGGMTQAIRREWIQRTRRGKIDMLKRYEEKARYENA